MAIIQMSQERTPTILITGAGAPGIRGTLFAIRNNPTQSSVRVVGTDISNDAIGRHFVDAFHQLPEPEQSNYLDELVDVCRREGVSVVLPQTTREIAVLSRCKDRLAENDVRVIVADADAIEMANDKHQVCVCFEKLELPFPQFRVADTLDELEQHIRDLGWPKHSVVVKPPVSNGMRGVRVIKEDAWDVRRFLSEKPNGLEVSWRDLSSALTRGEHFPRLLATEFLPGPEYSVDAFLGSRHQLAVPRLRSRIRSGISFDTQVEIRQDLIDYTLQAGQVLGLRYAYGMQFKLDSEGTPKVLECNPRVQGTMAATVLAGANLIWLSVLESLGRATDEPRPQVKPLRFQRYWGGIGLSEDGIREI